MFMFVLSYVNSDPVLDHDGFVRTRISGLFVYFYVCF